MSESIDDVELGEGETAVCITTSIGAVAGGTFPSVHLVRAASAGESGLAIACNGQMAAVVMLEIKDADGADQRTLPAEIAKPKGSEGRVLCCGEGPSVTLFGRDKVWVDREGGRFVQAPGDKPMPPVCSAFPDVNGRRALRLDAEMLHRLSLALNDVNTENRGVVTLLLPERPRQAIAVLGESDIGVLMPIDLTDNEKRLAERFERGATYARRLTARVDAEAR